MTTRPDPPIRPTLYDTLAQPAPPGRPVGETSLTATKETLDNDTEDISDDDIIRS